jgi:potassium-dependent mechanosensitive channel
MRSFCLTLFLLLHLTSRCFSQEAPEPTPVGPQPTATASPIATPSVSETPFFVGEIPVQLELAQQLINDVSARLTADTSAVDIEPPLSSLAQEMQKKVETLDSLLDSKPSTAELRSAEQQWGKLQSTVRTWKARLEARNREIDEDLAKLDKAQLTWSNANKAQLELPQALSSSIRLTESQLLQQNARLRRSQLDALTMLTRVTSLDSKIQDIVERLAAARRQRLASILTLDSEPIWRVDFSQLNLSTLPKETLASLRLQIQNLGDYFGRESSRFLGHAIAVFLLFAVLHSMQARVRLWMAQEETLKEPSTAFESPLLTTALLSSLIGSWFYPDPLPLLSAILIAAALFPAFVVLKRLVGKQLHPTLYAIATLFCFDTLRLITAPQVLLTRILFSFEFACAFIYLAWRVARYPLATVWGTRIRALVISIFGLTLLAVNLGFVRLAYTAGDASLHSLYLGALLVPLVRVFDGVNLLLHRTKLFIQIQTATAHRTIHAEWWIRAVALAFWATRTLDFLGVRQTIFEWVSQCLDSSLHIGALELRLGATIGFGLALWIPYRISGVVRAVLEQSVYPKLELSRGVVYTLSTVVHYSLLLVGGTIGLGILGLDLAKFTILASALGVGIGFGLQNIVNNFVSGLILLLERPIQVGHVIEVAGQIGRLERIGLRASVIRTADGSEVIVPNGELLSTRVTNWTLSDQRRLLRIPVGVGYGSSLEEVKQILMKTAGEHPKVLSFPVTEVHMLNLGDNALELELRAWTDDFDAWQQTRSQLLSTLFERLTQAGVDIPYPQRTVHIKSEQAPIKALDEPTSG